MVKGLTGDGGVEHRGITEATVRGHPFGIVLGFYRARGEFRWIDGELSVRFRNMIRAERRIVLEGFALIPFGSFEISYDTRFDVWNRTRWTFGIQGELSSTIVLEGSFARQHDTRSQPTLLNALGSPRVYTCNAFRGGEPALVGMVLASYGCLFRTHYSVDSGGVPDDIFR